MNPKVKIINYHCKYETKLTQVLLGGEICELLLLVILLSAVTPFFPLRLLEVLRDRGPLRDRGLRVAELRRAAGASKLLVHCVVFYLIIRSIMLMIRIE